MYIFFFQLNINLSLYLFFLFFDKFKLSKICEKKNYKYKPTIYGLTYFLSIKIYQIF